MFVCERERTRARNRVRETLLAPTQLICMRPTEAQFEQNLAALRTQLFPYDTHPQVRRLPSTTVDSTAQGRACSRQDGDHSQQGLYQKNKNLSTVVVLSPIDAERVRIINIRKWYRREGLVTFRRVAHGRLITWRKSVCVRKRG